MEEKITLPVNRTLYLDRLLRKNEQIEIEPNQNYKNMIQETQKPEDKFLLEEPKLETELRDYQKTGYKWLTVLDQYEFGGILADDMGLRENNSSLIPFNRKQKTSKTKRYIFSSCAKFFNVKLEK